jgi:hypothetical protein
MIRLACILEIDDADTIDDAVVVLNRFRESVRPALEYGILIAWATREDLSDALTADDDALTADGRSAGDKR